MGKIKIRYKQGTIAYSGSWLTQNFSEKSPKGFLVWNTKDKSSKFFEIPNDYSFVNIHIKNSNDINKYLNENYTSKTRLRIIIEDAINNIETDDIKIKFVNKYNLEETPRIVSGTSITQNIEQDNKDLWMNYTDINYQLDAIKEYLKNKGDGEEVVEQCQKIHRECIKNINVSDYVNTQWKVNYLNFSYIGSYGKDNSINFKNQTGLIGLFSQNKMGKSTILETISFSIFGSPIKNINNEDLINLLHNSASTEIELELNSIVYKISRTLKRKKNGGSSGTVKFEKFINNSWIDLNEDDSTKTNKLIESLFGNQKDLLYTALSGQEQLNGLIDSKQSERLKTIYRFINLNFFEDLYNVAKSKIESLNKEIEVLEKTNNSQIYQQLENRRKTCQEEIEIQELSLENIKKNIKELSEKIFNISKDVKNIDNQLDIVKTKEDFKSIEKQISDNEKKYNNLQKEIVASEKEIEKNKITLKEKLQNKKLSDIVEKLSVVKENEKLLNTVQQELKIVEKDKKEYEKNISILNKHDWFDSDENCKNCTFLHNAWEAKDKIQELTSQILNIENSYKEKKNILENIGYTSDEITYIQSVANEYQRSKNNLEVFQLKLETVVSDKKTLELKKEQFQKILKEHNDVLLLIESNISKIEAINNSENKKKELENSLETCDKNLWSNKAERAKLEGQMLNIEDKLKDLLVLEEQRKYYEKYMKCVGKNGIPFEIMKQVLPKINSEVNSILSDSQDWQLSLKTVENNLEINIVDISGGVGLSVESCSGGERQIAALGIRIALSRLSFLPKPDFFIVDEGFSFLDSFNIIKVNKFLQDMKQFFKFILIISHIENMKDSVDQSWDIFKNEDGVSSVNI